MKRAKREKAEQEVIKRFPISNRLNGWYFRIVEVSNNVFEVEGTDLFGRLVSRKGTEPETLLDECIEVAAKIES